MDVRQIATEILNAWTGEGIWAPKLRHLAAHVLRSPEPLGECEWCKAGNDPEDGQHFVEYENRTSTDRYVACVDPRFNHGKALVMIADQNRLIAALRAQLAAAQKEREDAVSIELERRKTFVSDARQFAAWMEEKDKRISELEKRIEASGRYGSRMAELFCGEEERRKRLEQASEARGQEARTQTAERCAEIVLDSMRHYEDETCTLTMRVGLNGIAQKIRAEYDIATPAATPAPACGCIPCRCEHETQCQGCGAKMCDQHKAERAATPAVEHSDVRSLDWCVGYITEFSNGVSVPPRFVSVRTLRLGEKEIPYALQHYAHIEGLHARFRTSRVPEGEWIDAARSAEAKEPGESNE